MSGKQTPRKQQFASSVYSYSRFNEVSLTSRHHENTFSCTVRKSLLSHYAVGSCILANYYTCVCCVIPKLAVLISLGTTKISLGVVICDRPREKVA